MRSIIYSLILLCSILIRIRCHDNMQIITPENETEVSEIQVGMCQMAHYIQDYSSSNLN